MVGKTPTGPHADVAERFAFLLEAVDLDREGFAAAVDGAVTPRSLYAILAGDRRPSRALAVLVERTFGFRADHLLHGSGPMWARSEGQPPQSGGVSPTEERLLAFGRRSVENARVLADEVDRAEAWERMWQRALALLTDLERLARDDPAGYPAAAAATLHACWAMAEAFSAWTDAQERRRVVGLTGLFVRRFLVQVPGELAKRGVLSPEDSRHLQRHAAELLDELAADAENLEERVRRAEERISRLTGTATHPGDLTGTARALDELLARVRASAPTRA